MELYTSVFPDSKAHQVMRDGPDSAPDAEGTVQYAHLTLAGHRLAVMDSAHDHDVGSNEAISFLVRCDDQAEIDRYCDALSAVPEAEQCGWLKDRFGVSRQIVPGRWTRC